MPPKPFLIPQQTSNLDRINMADPASIRDPSNDCSIDSSYHNTLLLHSRNHRYIMASPDVDSPWLCAASESFGGCFNIQIEEVKSTNNVIVMEVPTSSVYDTYNILKPPPYPNTTSKTTSHCKRILLSIL
ncbi:hypothetical protein SADUNF_Sadunf07G0120600 [Salix dunnii]|uniref:Uncharacterized protein n=1 Tax=Salix dunnii TaxID=1413687 RepID=A0A835MZK0_9ROSI|nr:hypothetical protein SADUNF_Sadunf07G0120600 [Salix dunnii]